MAPGPKSLYFSISTTSYGGRSAFATQAIPRNTLVLTCETPYVSVICRKFKKEVCGWCFTWSREMAKKNSWKITVPLDCQLLADTRGMESSQKAGAGNQSNAGVWFCSEECQATWIADGEETGHMAHAGARGAVNAALERCLVTMGRDISRRRSTTASKENESNWISFLQSLEDLKPGDHISSVDLNDAWDRAVQLSSTSRLPPQSTSADIGEGPIMNRASSKGKAQAAPLSPALLSEFELDTARFVLAGLLKKLVEGFSRSPTNSPGTPPTSEPASSRVSYSSGSWSDVLDLQDNTLPHTLVQPHILASSIRVWAFNKFVIHSALRDSKNLSEETKTLLRLLKLSVDSPLDTRTILGREHGNVFGIWDMAPEGVDSEMLGWGLYPFGSYFNHNCSPTLYKKRSGRAMEYYTLRDVEKGDELCISYVDNNEEVTKRREALREWFFECDCVKCEAQLCS